LAVAWCGLVVAGVLFAQAALAADRPSRPNIIFILADDLGWGELSCYGQTKYRTPHIDRLADEGLRFTQCYAGSNVCAPSRSCLMTGLHTGHTPIRANNGGNYLYADDLTVAEVLKSRGYKTGLFGKWGLGIEETPGHPNRQGFDEFFGQMHQVHAHFYYPYFLWKNETRYFLPENEGRRRGRYTQDEVQAQALDFIRRSTDGPFFCYLAYTIPHVELVAPDDSVAPFRGKFPETPLPDPRPGYIGADEPYATFAGMVTRLDRYVGEVLNLLRELQIDDQTLVLFSSDNGAQGDAWKRMTDFFQGNGELRGYKGQFYEGGIRVPFLARWPGQVPAGKTTDHVCAFWDFLPTAAELAGAEPPPNLDGLSIVPTLLGRGDQPQHKFLYWEYSYRNGLVQAVRMGDMKAVQPRPGAPMELYDVRHDPREQNNLAGEKPDVLRTIQEYLATARSEGRVYVPPQPQPTVNDYVK
jgi:arylsulfatase A-like enzyme